MKKYTSFDELPLTLNAEDVQAVMNISRAGAYTLMHREDFPTIRIGKRMLDKSAYTKSWKKHRKHV